MTCSIIIPGSVKDTIKKIPKKSRLRIFEKIDSLADNPRPSGFVKMKGTKRDLYRIRFGKYRIIYQVKDSELLILVIDVGHRKDVYRSY